MLFTTFFKKEFFVFGQCGFYFDYILKKFCEIFIRNFLIYGSQFFAEKYLIEFVTKTKLSLFFFKIIKKFDFSQYFYDLYFYNIISTILLIISFFNFLIFLI